MLFYQSEEGNEVSAARLEYVTWHGCQHSDVNRPQGSDC